MISAAPARTNARLAVVQALYQMEIAGVGVDTTVTEFRQHRLGGDIEGHALHDADEKFFEDLTRGVVALQARIDPVIERNLAERWTLGRLDATARAILRAGVYEIVKRADVPAAVIIDEYVEIASAFFERDEPRFINAVLDAVSRDARAEELADAR